MTKKSFKKADPNYQKELAKYGNPIPSRDYILQIIRENNSPMRREEILTALSMTFLEILKVLLNHFWIFCLC